MTDAPPVSFYYACPTGGDISFPDPSEDAHDCPAILEAALAGVDGAGFVESIAFITSFSC